MAEAVKKAAAKQPEGFHVFDWRTGETVSEDLTRAEARAMVAADTRTLRIGAGAKRSKD